MSRKGFRTYENGMLLILALSFGFAFFDRNAVNYLAPYLVRDLGLSNTQVGMLGSVLALSWAISALVIGRWSDAVGVRKPFLVGILLVFSVCSVLSGLATSFPMLLAARLIMGIAEGPMMPICLAILMAESSPSRRGLNIGIVQSLFSSLIGASLAPLILVRLAEWFNWRIAFFLAGIPGILCAIAVMRYIREPKMPDAVNNRATEDAGQSWRSILFSKRNMWLCPAMACLMVSWLMLHQNFLPLFLTTVRRLTNEEMSEVMAATGLCAAIAGFLGAAVSDRLGRKPVVIATCLISLLTPLSGLYFNGSLSMLTVLMFIGWIGTAAFPLFMSVIPAETVTARHAATAMGLVTFVGEVVGGSGAPLLGGWAADLKTLAAPIMIAAICAFGGTILSLFLKETAPIKAGASAEEKKSVPA
ncbi:MAG: MFS transporter [Acidobacteria bacterium]|nr:MFS transporter [Acidobacteriota bacterium]